MEPIVELIDVIKTFDGREVLKGINFSVMPWRNYWLHRSKWSRQEYNS